MQCFAFGVHNADLLHVSYMVAFSLHIQAVVATFLTTAEIVAKLSLAYLGGSPLVMKKERGEIVS